MITTIKWKNPAIELPRIDEEPLHPDNIERSSREGVVLSEIVLITDGNSILSGVYTYSSIKKEYSEYEEGTWIQEPKDRYSDNIIDVVGWCYYGDISLPEPIIGSEEAGDDDKRYTLKQLRQAWGKGFHDGKKNEPCHGA
jgi:hypothetical protein